MDKKFKLIGMGAMLLLGIHGANAQVSIKEVYPEPSDKSYDYNTYMEITVTASEGITTFDEATFNYNDKSIILEKNTYAGLNGAPDSQFLQLKVSYPGLTNYVKQAVGANADSFTIKITGVMCGDTPVTASSLDNPRVTVDNGTVSLTYPLQAAPTYLPEESVWPDPLYSYYAPGAPGSTATLVFSQPVVSAYESTLVMMEAIDGGSAPGEDVESYTIPYSFDGNRMILDFSDKHFEGTKKTVTVIIRSVDGDNGLPADFGGGSVTIFQHLSYVNETAPGSSESDGVETILQEDLKGKSVYNLKGEKVDSRNLEKGIYVINGKKVMVK